MTKAFSETILHRQLCKLPKQYEVLTMARYSSMVLLPSASMFFRILCSNDNKALYYLERGIPAECVVFYLFTRQPLLLFNNYQLTPNYLIETEKCGAILFYTFRHCFDDVEATINAIKDVSRFSLDTINVDELNDLQESISIRTSYSQMINYSKERFDDMFLDPLHACRDYCVERLKNKKSLEIDEVYSQSIYGLRVTGDNPQTVKDEADRVYYSFGKAILPHTETGIGFLSKGPVINDESKENVFGTDWTRDYVGLLKV